MCTISFPSNPVVAARCSCVCSECGSPCVEPINPACLLLGQYPILCGWIQSADRSQRQEGPRPPLSVGCRGGGEPRTQRLSEAEDNAHVRQSCTQLAEPSTESVGCAWDFHCACSGPATAWYRRDPHLQALWNDRTSPSICDL